MNIGKKVGARAFENKYATCVCAHCRSAVLQHCDSGMRCTCRRAIPNVPSSSSSRPRRAADLTCVARLVGERLAASMGQPVVIENRPGAIGTIGLNAVAKAPPDGYTLGVLTTAYLAAPSLIAQMPYDTGRDLSPVAVVSSGFQNLNVRSTLPVYSVSELVSEAKAQAGCPEVFVAGQRNTGSSRNEALRTADGNRAHPRSVQGRASSHDCAGARRRRRLHCRDDHDGSPHKVRRRARTCHIRPSPVGHPS